MVNPVLAIFDASQKEAQDDIRIDSGTYVGISQ